jgi:hypothetical protein
MFTAMDTQFIPTLSANRFLPDIDADLDGDEALESYCSSLAQQLNAIH